MLSYYRKHVIKKSIICDVRSIYMSISVALPLSFKENGQPASHTRGVKTECVLWGKDQDTILVQPKANVIL